MTPWITPHHRHSLLLARPVAYVTRCGRGLWLLGAYQSALAGLTCDAVICDPPYSARTHKGHNDGVSTADRLANWTASAPPVSSRPVKRADGRKHEIAYRKRLAERGASDRRTIDYAAWGPRDVHAFMRHAHAMCRGWIVAMCSHDQHRQYVRSAARKRRYAFDYPIIWYAPGSRVRMTGDGPANWSAWIAVSRPRSAKYLRWGALPGGYEHTTKADQNAGDYRIGGKPVALMLDLVADYSREGDTVCDPTAGYATTGVAALMLGRRFIGVECDRAAWEHGRDRLAKGTGRTTRTGQGTLC